MCVRACYLFAPLALLSKHAVTYNCPCQAYLAQLQLAPRAPAGYSHLVHERYDVVKAIDPGRIVSLLESDRVIKLQRRYVVRVPASFLSVIIYGKL